MKHNEVEDLQEENRKMPKPVEKTTIKDLVNDYISVVVIRDRRHNIVETLRPSKAIEKYADNLVNWYYVKPYDLICNCLEVRF